MASEGIKLWVCPPALGPAPYGQDNTGDPVMNLPWTHTGMPAITFPFGVSHANLPLGLQVISALGMDEYLLAWSHRLIPG